MAGVKLVREGCGWNGVQKAKPGRKGAWDSSRPRTLYYHAFRGRISASGGVWTPSTGYLDGSKDIARIHGNFLPRYTVKPVKVSCPGERFVSTKASASNHAAIVRHIKKLHSMIREDVARNPAKRGQKRKTNPTLRLHYRIGELIEEFRLACEEGHGSVWGAKWASAMVKKINERLAQAEIYSHLRYALSFRDADVEGHMRKGLAWRDAKLLSKCDLRRQRHGSAERRGMRTPAR